MKIEVTRQNGKVTVSVTVPHYNDFGCKEKIRINTTDVMAALTTEGHKNIGHCTEEGSINNKRRTSSVWVFEDTTPRRKKTPPPSKKHKKTLDNSSKDVIIKSKPKL
jgi:hypothetical protein